MYNFNKEKQKGARNMNFYDLRIKDTTGVMHYTPDMTHWTAENRRDHIVGIQLDGSAVHDFKNKQITLSSGSVFFFNQKDDYSVTVEKFGLSLSVHFTTYCNIETDSFCISVSDPTPIVSLLNKIKLHHETGNEMLTLSYLYSFCNELWQLNEKKYFPKEQRVLNMRKHIDTHYIEKNCLRDAIMQSNLSERQFSKLFRNTFNTTPSRYIITRRVERAKQMLETNMFSVTNVAEKCGFSDVYYFSKVFKKETGVSPGKYYKVISEQQ